MADELVGKAVLNGYLVHVISEQVNDDANLPSYPVEKGINLTDHVEREPVILNLSGRLIRPTQDRLETLVSKIVGFKNTGTLITYSGRRIYRNMMIESFSFDATEAMANGYDFSMTLKEVRFAKPSFDPGTKAVGMVQTANKKTSPIYHVVKKGDTYWALGKKYGVAWQQLEKWNKYPPTKIPIGVKLKVG